MSITLAVASTLVRLYAPPAPVAIQYIKELPGQPVIVSIDGGRAKTTYAGKMGFRDVNNLTWASVCCDVRSPVALKQAFNIQVFSSVRYGGNVVKAGNIVAKYFNSATTDNQCAALQLAVWEAMEDGGRRADFLAGRFQAVGNQTVMQTAERYYEAVADPGNAAVLRTTVDRGQSQIFPWPKDEVVPR